LSTTAIKGKEDKMLRFRDLPIRRKLILINTLTSIVALLVASVTFISYEVITFRQKMTRDLEILAKIIATNSTAALMFNDKKGAEEILAALSAQSHIRIACVYSSDAREFAKYVNPAVSIACPDQPLKNGHSFGADGFSLFQGIYFDKERTGTIYLDSDLEELRTRLKRDAGIGVLVLSLASLLVFFLSSRLQRLISQPILHLVETAKSVSENKDYSVRASKASRDESGLLIDTFNDMLTQIQERDKELTQKNLDLEETLQKLQKAQQTLITQEKMASLGALTAGLAHEIRNPLNFVTNFAELSAEQAAELHELISGARDKLGPDLDQDVSEVLSDIQSNAIKIKEHGDRANRIITGMLLHSRGVPGQRQPVDLNKLLDEYVDLSYHGMRAKDTRFNITIERDYDPAVGVVQVVPQDMSRVFLNLINNACYAADEKKRSSGAEFSPTVRVSTKNLDRAVEVRVRDNGNGIPAESLHKVFEPFFTTKPTGEGTGLGLSISYEIVVGTHHGEIRVDSEEGRFAEFKVVIPKV
jgi:signal transduction histidine kinase